MGIQLVLAQENGATKLRYSVEIQNLLDQRARFYDNPMLELSKSGCLQTFSDIGMRELRLLHLLTL